MTATQSRWLEQELRYDSGVYTKHTHVIVRGEGAHVWDEEGREYIDCIGGYGVANVGHANPEVVSAIAEQASRLMVLPQSVPNDRRSEFLTELAATLPSGLDRIFLCNSGAEAVEAAMKFSMTATGRHRFVAMKRGFSGRTLGAVSLTWDPAYREPFMPLIGPVEFVPFGDSEALRAAIDDLTAAVLIEPVQGEGGVRPATAEFLQAAREAAHAHGALFLLDEIQTGFCRTGKMFAQEHFGVVPDGMTLAKAMAGGVPIGAFAMREEIAKKMPKGGHGTTFGGNPLAMAAGLAALRFMKNHRLWESAAAQGERLISGLRSISNSKIREVRGLGLMVGVELKEKAAPYLEALERDHQILALQATPLVMRFLPPLVISPEDVDRVVAAVAAVLADR